MKHDDAALEILREFVADIDALAIMTRGDDSHRAAVDWPDLWETYRKATTFLRNIAEVTNGH